MLEQVRSSLDAAKSFFFPPARISQVGASRFYFYNHAASGRESINRLSLMTEPAIRNHAKLPIRCDNKLADKILNQLCQDGVAIFPIDQISDGSKIFERLNSEWATNENMVKDQVREWRRSLSEESDSANAKYGAKEYIFSFAPRASYGSPHWQLALHPDVLYIINSYMYAYAKIYHIDYLLNIPTQDLAAKKSQVWHRDGDGTVLKLFVYLSDVSAKHGPFTYAPGTHSGALRKINYKSGKRPQTDSELRELLGGYEREFVPCVGQKGTVVIANTSGMHKGGHVLEGERKVLVIAYYPPWIDRSDYGLSFPNDLPLGLHPAQLAALSRTSNDA